MGLIIDSSAFIQLESGGRDVDTLTGAVDDQHLAMASISASELAVGIHKADSPERSARRQRFPDAILAQVDVEPFDIPVAYKHAEPWAHLSGAGQMISAHDLIIAATALTLGYSLLTHNLRDFSRVPGLTVQPPAW